MVPDYYAMLGLDLRADRPAIEAALDRARHQWSSGTRNPKYKHTYQSNLDQVPEIRRCLLGDPSARAAYDAELQAAEIQARGRRLDELQRLVRLRAAKGGLTVSDRAILRDRATGLGLSSDDLARLTAPFPPRPEAPVGSEPTEPAEDSLDPVTRRQIQAALDLVAKTDLYDALDLPRDASRDELLARADAERDKWMRKSHVTAEKTAWLEVVSYVQSHLDTAGGRSRYDRSLIKSAEDAFTREVDFAIEGLASLDQGTRAALLDEAAARGVPPDRADRLIVAACRTRGVARDGGQTNGPALGDLPPRYLRCRSCGGLTDHAQAAKDRERAACRHCRATLRWTCPVCRKGLWIDAPRCSCGFELKNLEPLLRHFEASQHAYKVKDYAGALGHLSRVEAFAPRLNGARKAAEKVKARLAEIETARGEFALARSGGRLVAARAAWQAWAGLVDPASPALLAAQAELLAGLREAQELVARARGVAATDPRAARALYRQALAVAADLGEAREGLHALPPDPPTALAAQVEPEGVVLRWSPPAADGLGPATFRVVRKVGAVPGHAQDGAMVAEVEGSEALDREVRPARSVGYAVFTCRDGRASILGASVAPLTVLPEVRDLRAEGSRGEVSLSWTLPAGASTVKVVRLGGPGGTDRSVEALADHAVDRGLEDTRIYRYRVSAVYRGEGAATMLSPGVEIAASPSPPAAPAGPLVARGDAEGRVALSWPAVPRGTIKVLRSGSPPPYAPGARIASGEAARLEGQWLEIDRSDGATDPEPPSVGVWHYTPLVFLNGTATVGTPVGFSTVPDPSDLRAVRAGGAGRVHLRWRWTARASEAVVVARSGGPPEGADDPLGVSARVGEVEYSRQGYFSLALPVDSGGGAWHLAVYSVVNVDGIKITSPGLAPTARTVVPGPNPEVTVSYALKRPSFPGRPWSVSLRTEPPGSATPPLALVAHPRTVPLSADDGQIVERFPAARDGATFSVRPRVDLARHRVRIFADPSADPSGMPPIKLRHPESAGTRV